MGDESVYARTNIDMVFGASFKDFPCGPQVLKEIVPADLPCVGAEIKEHRIEVAPS
jgi:hypothetical protein